MMQRMGLEAEDEAEEEEAGKDDKEAVQAAQAAQTVAQAAAPLPSPESVRAVVRVQAMVRARVQRVIQVRAMCAQTGSALAMPGTVQGRSGYYETWIDAQQRVA